MIFLLFYLNIFLVYFYNINIYNNNIYDLMIIFIFFIILILSLTFQLVKKTLCINSKQILLYKMISK